MIETMDKFDQRMARLDSRAKRHDHLTRGNAEGVIYLVRKRYHVVVFSNDCYAATATQLTDYHQAVDFIDKFGYR